MIGCENDINPRTLFSSLWGGVIVDIILDIFCLLVQKRLFGFSINIREEGNEES